MQIGKLVISDSLYRLIQDRRSESACLKVLWRALFRMTHAKKTRFLATELPGNYFTYREKEGMISFMPPKRRQVINPDGTWKREGRQSIKPARWIRSILHPRVVKRIKDHVFSQFNDIVLHEELKNKVEFKLVPVSQGYKQANFTSFGSCMWNLSVAEFYEVFGCQCVVAVPAIKDASGRKAWRGRAILWPEVQLGGGINSPVLPGFPEEKKVAFMDRVYSDSSEVTMAMLEYARSQGWLHKEAQTRETGASVEPDGSKRWQRLIVHGQESLYKVKFFPYLDTMKYGSGFTLTNDSEAFDWDYQYEDTHGSRISRRKNQVQDIHGDWLDRADAVEINGLWYDPDGDDVVICSCAGGYVPRIDATYFEGPDGKEGYWVSNRYLSSQPKIHARKFPPVYEPVPLIRTASLSSRPYLFINQDEMGTVMINTEEVG